MLGEVGNQYAGIALDDARMEPYWALAEELDIPVDEEFFRVVRAVNASLPRERQLRVLLGGSYGRRSEP